MGSEGAQVDGRVIRTVEQLHALPEREIARCAHGLVDVLALLHAVDPGAVSLTGFGRPQGYLTRQVQRWYDQWLRVRTRELVDMDALYARLAAACPAGSGASIVHGDYRIDNATLDLVDPGIVRAVVDWEMATLADLGLHLVYSAPAFAPVLSGSAASTSDRDCLPRPTSPSTTPRPAAATPATSASISLWATSRSPSSPRGSTPASSKV
ncbi:phosphotransferase family protein [Streptomyces sp. NPDC005799]|uniref:phosphotransferase family protein n=1 Tax=Streptomyces sp. NPDC005799 TaxID=3154678 RepID=UPI0033DBBE0F